MKPMVKLLGHVESCFRRKVGTIALREAYEKEVFPILRYGGAKKRVTREGSDHMIW